ncbi:hypothetical protein TNCT_289021 [Trichonephila clavata]|uniref:Uncharacterized protein n=1 Tax=Trichonephila clavata TaxID=2740835 RepID=A0A8X6G8D1_TRICU|nr:hypothetical protein TNCT_289021 [Trichonephila clavata]
MDLLERTHVGMVGKLLLIGAELNKIACKYDGFPMRSQTELIASFTYLERKRENDITNVARAFNPMWSNLHPKVKLMTPIEANPKFLKPTVPKRKNPMMLIKNVPNDVAPSELLEFIQEQIPESLDSNEC